MAETKCDYAVGYGKPPVGRRFKKGQSGNPNGRRGKNPPPALLVEELDETVVVTTNGWRQKTARRKVVIARLVDKPAGAELPAIKMLTDMLKNIEKRVDLSPPPAEIA